LNEPYPDPNFPDKAQWWYPATLIDKESDTWGVTCSEDIIAILKLAKYEEPIPLEMAGHVRRWPAFLAKYDVENVKRPESMAAMVEGEEVVATEKLHGTNFTVAIGPGLEEGEEAFVCSRNNALKESDTNVYWRAVRKYDLITKLKTLLTDLKSNISELCIPFGWPEISVSLTWRDCGSARFKVWIC
jgi:RNA ligase (TIGR02306 family)